MYAGTEYIENYLNNKEYTKPFYMCEYVCSMSTGDVYPFWDLVEKYDNNFGGCIWEWCDHAVNVPDENGKARYFYGAISAISRTAQYAASTGSSILTALRAPAISI